MCLDVPEHAYERAVNTLELGGVIAYPTESVYGLGCDPFNLDAFRALMKLKQRDEGKGLILIAASWEQISPFLRRIEPNREQAIREKWPGPYTWLFPRTDLVPDWIVGNWDTVAVRVTAHPVANRLCAQYGKPIVSTSANPAGQSPARDHEAVYDLFGDDLDYILKGRVGEQAKPTEIRDAKTNAVIREGGG